MERANFLSFSNIEFIKKPHLYIKELNKKYDFKHLDRVLKRTSDYKISLIDEKTDDNSMDVDECATKKYNYENGISESITYDQESNKPSFGDYIIRELKEGYFNVKGQLCNFSAVPNNTSLKFNLYLTLRNCECSYILLIEGASFDTFEKFNKLLKNCTIYAIKFKVSIDICNFKSILVLRPINLNDVQINKSYSKIYIDQSIYNDNEMLISLNHSIRSVYELDMKMNYEKSLVKQSRMMNENDKNINLTKILEFYHNINPNICSTFNIQNNNAQVINDYTTRLNIWINQAEEFPDISELLIKEVEHSVYGMTNVNRINSAQTRKDVYGMIKSFKTDEKLDSLEIVSLKDSNVIKVLHYNKHINLNLKEGMIISIKGIVLKVNKNFDFYLENPELCTIKIYDTLNEEETNKIKKFRISKNKNFSCLIELTKPILIRTIGKYLVIFKKIYKIMAINEKNSHVVSGFPDLRLIAKCLVDDGTYEAQIYLHDQSVVNFLRIDKTTLTRINKLSEESGNVVIYEKLNAYKVLPKNYFDTIYIEQFIIYCIPFSNVAKKHFYDNNYNRYFENIGQINNLKNKALNMAFINGDIIFDKIQSDILTLIPRPFLRVIHIESIE